jgi:hypothetical protein
MQLACGSLIGLPAAALSSEAWNWAAALGVSGGRSGLSKGMVGSKLIEPTRSQAPTNALA